MSYRYESLEEALEFAASRLPIKLFGLLMAQVEDVITVMGDGKDLERKIYAMVSEYSKRPTKGAFSLDRLDSVSDGSAAAKTA